MPEDVHALHARLSDAGLHEHVEALVGLRAPAVRMRTAGGPESAEHGLRVAPASVGGLQRAAVAIASSRGEHVLAVLNDGSIVAWGENGRGQLGDGTRSDADVPVGVRDLDAVAAVACGGAHSVALRRDGSVFTWGDNEYRQVCDAKRKFFTKPVPVSGLDRGVRAVAAGERNSFAVLDDGSVLGWGSVNLGPGVGADGGLVPIRGLEGMVVSLASGWWHTLALMQDGSLFAWGGNLPGALGDGTTSDRYEPVLVRGLDGPVAAITAGNLHSVALMVDGTVMAWGSNAGGAIGHGEPVTKELEPVRVPLPAKAVAIAAGGMSNHALLRDGSVVSWGANSDGQLADGTVERRLTPVPMRGVRSDVQAVTLGAALLNDGSICRWGGTLAPSDDDDFSPTASSKLGGRPDLPQGTAWPQRDTRPMVLLAQVDLAEAAWCADSDEPWPRGGLLSLFVAPDALGEQGSWQLLFTEPGGELTRLPTPAELAGQDRIAAVPLVFAREMSWPPPCSAVLGALGLSSSQIAAYERAIDAEGDRPIHRMLGHPALIQPPDPRDADPELCLLMQIDSDDAAGWQWGDVGCIYVWIRRADLAAHRFDRALLNVQSA